MAPLGGDQYLDYSKFDILSETEKSGKIETTYKTTQSIEEAIDGLTHMDGDIRDALINAPADLEISWTELAKDEMDLSKRLGHDGMLAVSILAISRKQAVSASGPRLIAERARETTGL